jgi:hypothetical protein
MTNNPDEFHAIIQAAMEALRSGDKQAARRLARKAASLDPGSETPWLILASVSSPEASLEYIQKALQINPESKKAQQAMQWAQERLSLAQPEAQPEVPPEPAPIQQEAAPAPAPQPLPAQGQPKKRTTTPIIILVGLAAIALIACMVFLLGGYYFAAPTIAGLFHTPTPTLPCGLPTLTVGPLALEIKTIALEPDGSLPKVPKKAGVAWWVLGTQPDYVFILPQVRENLDAIPSLSAGAPLTITWADCGQEAFVVKAVAPRNPFQMEQVDQSTSGATLVLPVDSTGTAMVVSSGWPEAPQAVPSTRDPNAVQAEINFLETSVSPDGGTLTQVIEIKNTGTSPISLSASDISLSYEGSLPQGPLSTEPALPAEIAPGQSLALTITFAKPPTNTAVFRILDFSADLYY